jgi:hypothetical protein
LLRYWFERSVAPSGRTLALALRTRDALRPLGGLLRYWFERSVAPSGRTLALALRTRDALRPLGGLLRYWFERSVAPSGRTLALAPRTRDEIRPLGMGQGDPLRRHRSHPKKPPRVRRDFGLTHEELVPTNDSDVSTEDRQVR